MAYKINRSDDLPILPDGLATVRDIQKYVMQIGTPEFYELEAAEVIEVLLYEDDLPLNKDGDPDWSRYGWIRARMSISSADPDSTIVDDENDNDIILIKPLDSNIKEYPHPGEYVVVANYFGDLYYTQKLNMFNSVNLNSFPGLSRINEPFIPENYNIKEFRENSQIRQVQADEGDIIFNGRFGQSIRFGSNITEIIIPESGKLDPNSKKGNSPNIILRTGQSDPIGWRLNDFPGRPVKEDINRDHSSIWMTTDQKVDIDFSNKLTPGFYTFSEKGPDGLGGNQIIINSDRLIFNSKKNAILMTSPTAIGLSANSEIGLEVPNDTGRVLLGDPGDQTQPALGGKLTMELVEKLIDYLITFANGISSAKGTCVNITVPISDILPSSKGLVSSLKILKTRMDEPKSKTVHVGHIRGPE